ncbi:hypothetical protein QMK61_09010 [Fulvimonas sp. R45]|jgi:hypothetical protein|uniref:hypothetical protein n=1 Tax=Fulvimonas sp. R45 TaxID=3045937 RepID=UPI00265E17E4|nr:hypothetical protein [Fulvimonas sp. R45]MDO1528963.1 hypothetical protein [Fulvimonas sp. R45]
MMGLIRPVLAACLVCGMSLTFPARAESGRITFNGAIVVPTCAAPVEPEMEAARNVPASRSFACGGRAQATGHADTSTYRLSVMRLDKAATAGSPLLQYFVDYRASMHAADAQLVTRTYE